MAAHEPARPLLRARYVNWDEYAGTAEQLCACGLVQPGQFPGQPGRGKVRATYFLADGQPVPRGCGSYELTYTVQRLSASRFSVSVEVSDEEAQRRYALNGKSYGALPLDLPPAAASVAATIPPWTPEGFTFRRHRQHRTGGSDFVFETGVEALRASGLLGVQSVPVSEDGRHKSFRVDSDRFGWVTVAQRTAQTFIVVLQLPREIRNADYTVSDYGHSVHHRGTKQQLQDRGIGVGIGFPGEPGCHRRKVTLPPADSGEETCIELMHRGDWCGDVPRFHVTAWRSEAQVKAAEQAKRDAEAEKRRPERLKAMPATPQAFRDRIAKSFWAWADFICLEMQPKEGYRFTSGAVDDFMEAATNLFWVLKNGDTEGHSPLVDLQEVLGARAKSDQPLQRFLAGVGAGSKS